VTAPDPPHLQQNVSFRINVPMFHHNISDIILTLTKWYKYKFNCFLKQQREMRKIFILPNSFQLDEIVAISTESPLLTRAAQQPGAALDNAAEYSLQQNVSL
jgi:metallophosphoesterase superfamily enzyme